MRKLVESTFVTLDGSISEPQNWSPPYWDEEHMGYAGKLLFAADALLLGRATYEGFAQAWPEDPSTSTPTGSTACPSTSPRARWTRLRGTRRSSRVTSQRRLPS